MVVQDLLAKLDQQEQMENVVNLGLRGLMDKGYSNNRKQALYNMYSQAHVGIYDCFFQGHAGQPGPAGPHGPAGDQV